MDLMHYHELPNYNVLVRFGAGIPADAQGPVMLAMELGLRNQGIPAEVYKDRQEDDSKLRNAMTPEMRKKL